MGQQRLSNISLKGHMRNMYLTMTWIVSLISLAVETAMIAISFNVFYELTAP